MNKPLSTKEAKEMYTHANDPGGWALFREAEKILGKFSYAHFAYEDNRGAFEEADGYDLLKYLLVQYDCCLGESNASVDRWRIACAGHEQCVNFDIDKTTPEYQEFENKLYNGVLDRLHLTQCDACNLDNVRIVITLRDGKEEKHLCLNCLAQKIIGDDLKLVNNSEFTDDITGKHGAILFNSYKESYSLGAKTMMRLLRYALTPKEWKALTAKYGKHRFMLHDDFYDENGNALQPMSAWIDVREEEIYCPDQKYTITRTTQTCMHCNARFSFVGSKHYLHDNYCPECGTRMEKEDTMKYHHFDKGYEFTDKHGVRRYVHDISYEQDCPRYETYPVVIPENTDAAKTLAIFDEHELSVLQILESQSQLAQRDRSTITVDTPLGKLCATIGGEPNEYPEIFVYLTRPDGVEIDLVAVEVKKQEQIARAYLYGDTSTEQYTRTHDWTADELHIQCD